MYSKLFFIALVLAMTNIASSVVCPTYFSPFGNYCYNMTSQAGLDWDIAFATCNLDTVGYLVEIGNSDEQQQLKYFINEFDYNGYYYYWIGASDIQQEGRFRWMTSGDNLAYSAWNPGQPDNYLNNEDCAHADKGGGWNDIPCATTFNGNNPFKGICEADPIG